VGQLRREHCPVYVVMGKGLLDGKGRRGAGRGERYRPICLCVLSFELINTFLFGYGTPRA